MTARLLPWSQGSGGLWRSWVGALWSFTARPADTFARLPPSGGTARALSFSGLAFATLAFCSMANLGFVFSEVPTEVTGSGGSTGQLVFMGVLFTGLGLGIWFLVLTPIEWLALQLIRPGPRRLSIQVRVACYALAPLVLVAVVPCVGFFVGPLWAIGVRTIGMVSLQRVGWLEALVAQSIAVIVPLAAAAALRLDIWLIP